MTETPRMQDVFLEIEQSDAVRQHHITEMLTRELANRVIKPGDTVLDVGANRGFHTFAFADLVGETGKVHAFEPNPMHWANLAGKPTIRLWPFAAGTVQSVERFFFPKNHDGAASLHDPRDFLGADWETEVLTVIQVPIGAIAEITDRWISFIKIDVERHEFAALTGMREIIVADRPVIVLENCTADIEALFAELDYRLYPLTWAIHPDQIPGIANVVFCPAETDPALVLPEREGVLRLFESSKTLPR